MQSKSIKRAVKLIIMNHINEEYKQPNKRELSDVPDPPVPCAEPENLKMVKQCHNTLLHI